MDSCNHLLAVDLARGGLCNGRKYCVDGSTGVNKRTANRQSSHLIRYRLRGPILSSLPVTVSENVIN